MVVFVRTAFSPGEELELLPFEGKAIPFTPLTISNVLGEVFEKTRPGLLVKLPYFSEVKEWNILRKRVIQ